MSEWWWYSVPCSLVFVAAAWVFGHLGFQQSGLFISFLLIAVITSASSGLWLFTTIFQVLSGSVRLSTRILAMLTLSVIPTVLCVLWLQSSH